MLASPRGAAPWRADDAYVQLRSLELELRRLHSEERRHVLYGAINMCAMPATARPGVGYRGAWLGRMENLLSAHHVNRFVAHKLRRARAQLGVGLDVPQPPLKKGRGAKGRACPSSQGRHESTMPRRSTPRCFPLAFRLRRGTFW